MAGLIKRKPRVEITVVLPLKPTRSHLGCQLLSKGEKVVISKVMQDSVALGVLSVGDILLAINGNALRGANGGPTAASLIFEAANLELRISRKVLKVEQQLDITHISDRNSSFPSLSEEQELPPAAAQLDAVSIATSSACAAAAASEATSIARRPAVDSCAHFEPHRVHSVRELSLTLPSDAEGFTAPAFELNVSAAHQRLSEPSPGPDTPATPAVDMADLPVGPVHTRLPEPSPGISSTPFRLRWDIDELDSSDDEVSQLEDGSTPA